MSKVKPYKVDKKERYEMIGDFYQIVTGLKSKRDVAGFFMGLFTPSEAVMFARRIQVAQLLLQGKNNREIKMLLGVGTDNITNVAHWLYNENNNCFKKNVERHLVDKQKIKKRQKYNDRYYTSDLDKYPEWRLFKKMLGL